MCVPQEDRQRHNHARCLWGWPPLIVHTDCDACDVFFSKMAKEFNFTDQGTPTEGLGIEIEQTESDITLCHTKYIEKLAETFLKGEANSKEHKTPACQGLHELFEVATDSKAPVDPDIMALYRFLVGSLLYTAMTVPTRRQLRRRHAEPGAQLCTPMSPSPTRPSASATTSYSPRTWASATFVAPPRTSTALRNQTGPQTARLPASASSSAVPSSPTCPRNSLPLRHVLDQSEDHGRQPGCP